MLLATAELDLKASFFKRTHQRVALVALDLDDSVLDGSPGSAALLEVAGEVSECLGGDGNSSDERDRLASSPAAGARVSDDSISAGWVGVFAF